MLKRLFTFLSSLLIFSFTQTAMGIAPGFYMGFGLGPASSAAHNQQFETNNSNGTLSGILVTGKPRSNNFAVEIFLGNKLNSIASVELDVNLMTPIKYKLDNSATACSSANARVHSIDLFLKAATPFSVFEAFAKAGGAAAYVHTPGSLNPPLNGACGKAVDEIQFRPVIAIGAGYELSQRWEIDVTATRLLVGGIINNTTSLMLNFSYHWVPLYCGQFLCD